MTIQIGVLAQKLLTDQPDVLVRKVWILLRRSSLKLTLSSTNGCRNCNQSNNPMAIGDGFTQWTPGWRGIQFDGGFNGDREDLAIVNNTIFDNPSDGIQLHNTFDRKWIASNTLYGNGGSQIQIWNVGDDPRILNNTLDGQELENVCGINVDMAPWSDEISNNLIVNCVVGIRNTAGGNPEVDFQLIFNCDTPLQGCQDADDDIIEADPDFVDDQNGDYHLGADSPAIDQGDDNLGLDLNFTHNDLGAYGGSLADPEMASRLFGTVVAGQLEVVVEAQVTEDYEYVVPDGVAMTMDELITVEAEALLDVGEAILSFEGSLTINGEAEIGAGAVLEFAENRGISVNDGEINVNGAINDLAIFRGIDNGDWNGINFGNDGGHNSVIDFAEISGSSGSGIDWSGSFIDLLSNSFIHDNGTGIFTALLNDDVEIEDFEIYDNLNNGVFNVLDEDEFTEQINFPPHPDDWGGEDDLLEDRIYTISFPAGAEVTFSDGLTIRTYAGDGGEAIGRIQALGALGFC